jgi:ADP-heptose:LPS heptosyltransferase
MTFVFLEFDADISSSEIVDSLKHSTDAQFENVSNWVSFFPDFGLHDPIYVVSNLRKSPNDLSIIMALINSGSKVILIENTLSLCAVGAGPCFENKDVINCCDFNRLEHYRLLYQYAFLTIFMSEELQFKSDRMLGKSLSKCRVVSDLTQIPSAIIHALGPQSDSLAIKKDKENKVFVYKDAGGLGDYFLALPAMMLLDAYYDDVTFGFVPSVASVFKQGSSLRDVVSYEAPSLPKGFDLYIDLDNYPPSPGGGNRLEFPTLNRLYQHASMHYFYAVTRCFDQTPELSLALPLLTFEISKPTVPCITVHPGSAFKEKCWPSEQYERLICKLSVAFPSIDIIVLRNGRDPILFQNDPSVAPKNIKFYSNQSLLDVAKIIGVAALHIGNDSGLTHIAGVLNTPIVAIFGSTPPETWGPLSFRKKIITNRRRCPLRCSNDIMKACHDRICINSISVDSVFEAAVEILGTDQRVVPE